jgi:GTP-binding protein HflX
LCLSRLLLPRRAILVGVQTQGTTDGELQASLLELRRLAETLGHEVDEHVVTQRRASLGASVLGKGKLEELGQIRARSLPGQEVAILVDTERLTRSQENMLSEATRGSVVMDRSRVILSIFKQHAQTRAAKLQVEMAELMYNGPSGVRSLDSGGGGKGAGESQSELSARHIRDRLAQLRKELAAIEKESSVRRERRDEAPKVAIVG